METYDLLPAFFCVPDITGFTKLIATADIGFSKEVIPALLRRLIESNHLKMNIGEIEGDAIFFYKTGRLPATRKVLEQCAKFYQTFDDFLAQVKKNNPVNYDKHLSNNQLGLKVIVHYGCAATANIKGRTKLIGTDVIIAHRLLKNSIPYNQYVLFTDQYLKKVNTKMSQLPDFTRLKRGCETYDYIGDVNYCYLPPDELV